jgi:hypothetical protein
MVSTAMQGGCICENASYLRIGTNNIELAALFAPKPQAMTAADDWTKEMETHGLPELKKIYALYGAGSADLVHAKYYKFPHNYNQVSREMMYAWVNRHLKLGHAEPIAEKPFTPIPPKELSVFDAAHPRPADALEAPALRRIMTEASDRQMSALEPDQRAQVIRSALRAMVLSQPLPKLDADPNSQKEIQKDGYTLHKGLLVGAGVELPSLGLVPPNWDGTVVVWVNPRGKAALFDAASGEPIAPVRALLKKGRSVASADLLLTGEFEHPPAAPFLPQKYHKDLTFAGYMFGYNLPLISQRARDVLAFIDFVRRLERVKKVRLVGSGKFGAVALLGRAAAEEGAVDRVAVETDGFDFDQVKNFRDEMMLPGALKYGGVGGLLRASGRGVTLGVSLSLEDLFRIVGD